MGLVRAGRANYGPGEGREVQVRAKRARCEQSSHISDGTVKIGQ